MRKSCSQLILLLALAPAACTRETYPSTPAPTDPTPATDETPDDLDDDYEPATEVTPSEVTIDGAGKTTTPPVQTLEPCADTKRHYALKDGGRFQWNVNKADGSPVEGKHKVTGELALVATDPLRTPALHLEFNRTGAFTGEDLRDERIGSAFFGAGDALAFTLERVTAKDGVLALPALGAAKELTLGGALAIAGKIVKVDVPVILSLKDDGYHVVDQAGAAYKIRTEWGLSAPLDALLAFASAQIEETVTLHFDLALTESCKAR